MFSSSVELIFACILYLGFIPPSLILANTSRCIPKQYKKIWKSIYSQLTKKFVPSWYEEARGQGLGNVFKNESATPLPTPETGPISNQHSHYLFISYTRYRFYVTCSFSLRNCFVYLIALSFLFAAVVVFFLSFLSFHFIESLYIDFIVYRSF